MYETLVTGVSLEEEDGHTYPVSKVYRVSFETEDQFLLWMAAAESYGSVHQERMKAE